MVIETNVFGFIHFGEINTPQSHTWCPLNSIKLYERSKYSNKFFIISQIYRRLSKKLNYTGDYRKFHVTVRIFQFFAKFQEFFIFLTGNFKIFQCFFEALVPKILKFPVVQIFFEKIPEISEFSIAHFLTNYFCFIYLFQ